MILVWFQKFWIELVAAVICGVLLFFLGWQTGASRKQHAWDVATAKAYQVAAEEAAELAQTISDTEKKHAEEINAVTAARDAAIASLRNRPARLPAAAAATCAGSTGSELSRPDSEFLVGLAARADSIATDLTACYAREDQYRKAMIGNRK